MRWPSWQIALGALMFQATMIERVPLFGPLAPHPSFGIDTAIWVTGLASSALTAVILLATQARFLGALIAIGTGIGGVVSLFWILGGLGLMVAGMVGVAEAAGRRRSTTAVPQLVAYPRQGHRP